MYKLFCFSKHTAYSCGGGGGGGGGGGERKKKKKNFWGGGGGGGGGGCLEEKIPSLPHNSDRVSAEICT